jgi:hypothetical protein
LAVTAFLYALAGVLLGSAMYLGPVAGLPVGGNVDVDQVTVAAQTLLRGSDPYAVIRPGGPQGTDYALFYPLTTAILALPLGALGVELARWAFLASSVGVLGYTIGKERPWLWPIALSVPLVTAMRSTQWSPLLTGAMLLPSLGFLAAAKPNIGLVMLARANSWQSARLLVIGGSVVLAISLVMDPQWPAKWLDALSGAPHFHPLIVRPFGVLMLAGLWRWRDPEARMLVALSLVPQTGLLYETLPALTVARNAKQAGFLAGLTWVVWNSGPLWPDAQDFAGIAWVSGMQSLCVLLTSLGLVLWRHRAD